MSPPAPDLARLHQILDAATPGEWRAHLNFIFDANNDMVVRVMPREGVMVAGNSPDTDLICAARNHLPSLLDQLEAATARAEQAEGLLATYERDTACYCCSQSCQLGCSCNRETGDE